MLRPLALVTGASSGIGLAFARRLAADGHDLVVVARRAPELERLRDEVATDVEVMVADLTDPDQLAGVEARAGARDRPVDLLVNNAGFGSAGKFWELPVDGEDRMVRLNVLALVRLTHAALPAMVERGRGTVVLLSSVGAFQPVPDVATYSATKAFVSSFGLAVDAELRGTGVRVTTVAPGFTRTDFQATANYRPSRLAGAIWSSPEQVVDAALAAVAKGRALCVPGPHNRVAAAFSRMLPPTVSRRVAAMMGGQRA